MKKKHPLRKYVDLCEKRQKEVIKLIHFLDCNGFDIAPASSGLDKHCCEEGGLVKHVSNVCDTILKLRESIAPDVDLESCIITALFHDSHKVCDPFGKPLYLPNMIKDGKPKQGEKQAFKVSDKKPYKKNNQMVPILDAYQSVIIVSRFIQLSPDEMQAIACHDGQYVFANREVAQREFPLTLILHWADMWSCRVLESKKEQFELEVK